MQVNVISKTIIAFIKEKTRLMNAGKFTSSSTTRIGIGKYYSSNLIWRLYTPYLFYCLTYLRLVCFFLGVVMALFVPDPSDAVDNRCAKWWIVMINVYLLHSQKCVSWNQIEMKSTIYSIPLIMIKFQLTPFSLDSAGLYFDLQGLFMPVFCLLFAHIYFTFKIYLNRNVHCHKIYREGRIMTLCIK